MYQYFIFHKFIYFLSKVAFRNCLEIYVYPSEKGTIFYDTKNGQHYCYVMEGIEKRGSGYWSVMQGSTKFHEEWFIG
jgi:hypothetical protein